MSDTPRCELRKKEEIVDMDEIKLSDLRLECPIEGRRPSEAVGLKCFEHAECRGSLRREEEASFCKRGMLARSRRICHIGRVDGGVYA